MNEREKYLEQLLLGMNLIKEIEPKLLEDEEIRQYLFQLENLMNKSYYHELINELKISIAELQNIIELKISLNSGRGNYYTKKSVGAGMYQDIDVQPVSLPDFQQNRPVTGIDFPHYILSDSVPIPKMQNQSKGNSHILMLSLLSFVFEIVFIITAIFIFR